MASIDKFDKKIDITIDYLKQSSNIDPRINEIYKGIRIKPFINTLRNIYNNGKKLEDGSIKYKIYVLTRDQIDKLNSNNFNWNKESLEEQFDNNITLLNEFVNKYNRYPNINEIYKHHDLGSWVNNIRNIFKNGLVQEDGSIKIEFNSKIKYLSKDRIDRLNDIGFIIKKESKPVKIIKKEMKDKWLLHFESLKRYMDEHDNLLPVYGEFYEDCELGNWVNKQRLIFNQGDELKNGTIKYATSILTKERIEKLNSINFDFIGNKEKYYKKEIKNTEDMNKKRRYLLLQLNKILINQKNNIDSKQDIDSLNKKIIKIIEKREI